MKLPDSFGSGAVCICSGLCAKVVLCFCLMFAAVFFSTAVCGEQELFDQVILASAKKHGVDPLLIKAVIWRESRFKPISTGGHGEIGLMQIKMVVAEDWAKAHRCAIPTPDELYDSVLNIEIGSWYLSQALKRWKGHPKQLQYALYEYNAGRTGFKRILQEYKGRSEDIRTSHPVGKYARAIYAKYVEYSLDISYCLVSNTVEK